jgi:hypothetical protein
VASLSGVIKSTKAAEVFKTCAFRTHFTTTKTSYKKGRTMDAQVPIVGEGIESIIFHMRGEKVIIDADLARLYGVPTKRLNEQVKRNKDRFPADFMFQLTAQEKAEVVANCDHLINLKFSRGLPSVFTEHGAVMAASILNTPRAVQTSILIVRTFIKLRRMFLHNAALKKELDELKHQTNDRFQVVFDTLDHLLALDEKPKRKIGFTAKEKSAGYAVKP